MIDRRDFMKVAGLAALGLMGKEVAGALAGDTPQGQKRLAMVIDVRKCQEAQKSGVCHKECIAACHRWHNVLDMGDPRHEVKWIWEDRYENLFPEEDHEYSDENIRKFNFIALCNHCDNPPCVRVCPTKATFKRESDGVVMFDPHRCLGCRYCMAACPYGARSFNWKRPQKRYEELKAQQQLEYATARSQGKLPDEGKVVKLNEKFPLRDKGVVEKCNFCDDVLAADPSAIPLCAKACQVQAMMFGDLKAENSAIRDRLKSCYTIRRKPGLGTSPQVYYII